MSKNIWDDEPFRDSPVEYKNGQWCEGETYTPAPENTLRSRAKTVAVEEEEEDYFKSESGQNKIAYAKNRRMEQEENNETEQESEDDNEEDYSEVLSDARLRLEQGKLYEMIMNHNLFEGVDSDPRAAKVVQKQIRTWAKTQMEIMLGMRQEALENSGGTSPFNGLEIVVLKSMAATFSKGATESAEAEEYIPEPVKQPKKAVLNSIGPSKPRTQPKPLQKKVEPIKRGQPKFRTELTSEEKSLELDYEPLDKPVNEMSQTELDERNKQAAERQSGRKAAPATGKAPMPDYAERYALAAAQAARATSGATGIAALNGKLSQLVIANVGKRS